MNDKTQVKPPRISIAVRAWNEEAVIRRTLESLFGQSLFEELFQHGESCEVICIPNGCTDRTAQIATAVFAEQVAVHPYRAAFNCIVSESQTAGRNHTWNTFVHELSCPAAKFLFLMDSDILFDRPETMFNMVQALEQDERASIASDQPIKNVALKARKSWRDRISLATSEMNGTIAGRFSGQLYCIRADVARRLYLPRDLGIDDGFIKAIVCTDFFTEEVDPRRVVQARNASHVYEAYTSVGELLKNQKRQMIGQTIVHVLVEHLKRSPLWRTAHLAETLKQKDRFNPGWVTLLVESHVRRERFFWRLFPGILTFRFERLWKMRGIKRLTHFPATLVGLVVTLIACAQAQQHFRSGKMHFWPKAGRGNVLELTAGTTPLPAARLQTS